MKYSLLNRAHPEAQLEDIERYQDLFEGGPRFRANIRRYLLQNEVEPAAVYRARCARAHYINYCARIVRWFAAAVFSCPPATEGDPVELDPFWAAFKEDADGRGTDLDVMLREAFVRALVARRAWLRVDFPAAPAPGMTLADADRAGLRRARLCAVPTPSVRHWRRAEDGSLLWVLEHHREDGLEDFADDAAVTTETWTLWRADGSAQRWATQYTPATRPQPESDIAEVEPPANPSGAIPLVELALPAELHLLAHIAEPQLEHFRKRNALSWAIDRTCYAMPAFFLRDARKPPTMGTGYHLTLGADERIEWPAPPSAPFEVVQSITRELVQEIHRVVEQMALSVDNNAAAAVGRSGDSKLADHAATQVVLPAFGERVREALEKVLDLVARGRSEAVRWSVGGMDRYDMADAGALTEMALNAEPLKIPSATHRRALMKALSRAQLPHLDETTRRAIDAEIEAGVFDEEFSAPGG